MASAKLHMSFRKYHRWLGFFLAGIISIYALSGILLIFRKTDFLKFEQTQTHQLEANLTVKQVASKFKIRDLSIIKETDEEILLNVGKYNKLDGVATITQKDYPIVLSKMVKLHKATTNSPLYWLNISFGVGLLFFVISAFLMFAPKFPMFKNGLKIAGIGALVAVLVVIFGS